MVPKGSGLFDSFRPVFLTVYVYFDWCRWIIEDLGGVWEVSYDLGLGLEDDWVYILLFGSIIFSVG